MYGWLRLERWQGALGVNCIVVERVTRGAYEMVGACEKNASMCGGGARG